MESPDIPRNLESVTPGWLTRVLRTEKVIGEAQIDGFEVERLGEGQGFMGDTARLVLHFAEDPPAGTPSSLVIKIPTSDRFLRGQGEALGIYEREIRFYEELAPLLHVKLPRCYYSAMDPRPFGSAEQDARSLESLNRMPNFAIRILMWFAPFLARLSRRRYVLLLEDLAPARIGDQVGIASEADLLGSVEALAQLQVTCWDSQRFEDVAWIHSVGASPRLMVFAYNHNRPHFEEEFGEKLPQQVRGILDWLSKEENVQRLTRSLSRRPQTLVHGDYRLDNLFFDDRSTDRRPILSDWQVPSWGNPLYDLAYFLMGSLDSSATSEREIALVRHYHDAILSGGVSGYDFARCQSDYEMARLLILMRMVSTIAEIDSPNERGVRLFSSWVDRLVSRMHGVDAERLLADQEEGESPSSGQGD